MHKHHVGFLYGLLAAATNAGTAIFTKLASEASTSTIVFVRFAICFLLLLPLCKGKLTFSYHVLPKHLTRGLAGLISMYCFFYAVKHLPLVNATTLTNTTPLFMPLVVFIFGKLIVSKKRMGAALLGFIGVLFMLRPSTDQFFEFASIAALGTGFFSAVAFFSIRHISKHVSTETILFHYFALSLIISVLPMIFLWKPIDGLTWIYLMILGVFSAVFQFSITKSFTHAPASKVSTVAYISVFISGLAGWWMFGEIPSIWIFIGAAISIAGGIVALLDHTPPRPLNPSK